jgi:hypothetical protein
MSKILKRPMFRKGGPTNEGIVSMAVPRGKYANSNIQDLIKQNPEMASTIKTAEGRAALISAFAGQGRSQNDKLSDLLIKGGLETMSARPDGNIFSTLAKSYKKPVDDYLKESQAEDSFQRQARLQGVTSAISSEDARRLAQYKNAEYNPYQKGKTPIDEMNYNAQKLKNDYKDELTLSQAKNISKLNYIADRKLGGLNKELQEVIKNIDPAFDFLKARNFEKTKEGFLVSPPPRSINGKITSPYKVGKTYFNPSDNIIYLYIDNNTFKPVSPPITSLFQ